MGCEMKSILIHEWEDFEYYKKLKKETNLRRWSWEFLRRNPEYQKEYQKFSQFPDVDMSSLKLGIKNGKHKGNIWEGAVFYVDAFHYTNPSAMKGETLEEYDIRCPYNEIMPFKEYLELKYHIRPKIKNPIEELLNMDDEWFYFCDINNDSVFFSDFPPWDVDVFPIFETLTEMPSWFNKDAEKDYYIEKMKRIGEDKSKTVLAFDIRQPIDKQIEEAKQLLLRSRESYQNSEHNLPCDTFMKRPNIRYDKLWLYIRILDVLSAGITELLDIASIIYPHEKNFDTNNLKGKIRKNIETAKRFRDIDYWKLQ